jgi:magnesium-transporting ATPase (P-type)
MTTAVLLGLMLAFEPKEPGIMQRSPRKPNQPILTKELSVKILIVSMLLLGFAYYVFQFEMNMGSIESARTAAATVFVMIEMAYLFNSRSLHVSLFKLGLFSNPFIWLGTSLMLILQGLFIFNPFLNIAFKTAPFSIQSWQIIGLGAVATFIIIEIEKMITNKILK